VGHQDRRQDEDRHQGRLRQVHQLQDRRDVRHQDHQVRRCEEQNQYEGRQEHQVHQCEGRRVLPYEGLQVHQDQDDYQDQDGNQRHQDQDARHQDQDGNQHHQDQDVDLQGLHDHLEVEELDDQLQTLGQEEAE
jgi:hypothetical protein